MLYIFKIVLLEQLIKHYFGSFAGNRRFFAQKFFRWWYFQIIVIITTNFVTYCTYYCMFCQLVNALFHIFSLLFHIFRLFDSGWPSSMLLAQFPSNNTVHAALSCFSLSPFFFFLLLTFFLLQFFHKIRGHFIYLFNFCFLLLRIDQKTFRNVIKCLVTFLMMNLVEKAKTF